MLSTRPTAWVNERSTSLDVYGFTPLSHLLLRTTKSDPIMSFINDLAFWMRNDWIGKYYLCMLVCRPSTVSICFVWDPITISICLVCRPSTISISLVWDPSTISVFGLPSNYHVYMFFGYLFSSSLFTLRSFSIKMLHRRSLLSSISMAGYLILHKVQLSMI